MGSRAPPGRWAFRRFRLVFFREWTFSFFPGPNFNFGGRTHTNGNLFLAVGSGSTLTLSDKVDAYKDVIRTGASRMASAQQRCTPAPCKSPLTPRQLPVMPAGTSRPKAKALFWNPLTATTNANWPTISTGSSPADYNHNLIDGLGSLDPTHSTGGKTAQLGHRHSLGTAPRSLLIWIPPHPKNRSDLSLSRQSATYDQASLRVVLFAGLSDRS